jgi:hypothetical protein
MADAAPLLAALEAPLTFFGHTHQQGGFSSAGSTGPVLRGAYSNWSRIILPGKSRIGWAAAGW